MTRNPQQTRQRLLQAAFEQIHAHGFQGMRVDEVLRKAELQKGAFYHHFSSKVELGYAVLEEQIRPLLESIWLEPLDDIKNPLTDFPRMFEGLASRIPQSIRTHGCPLNNLAQEMASQDEGFQQGVAALFGDWIKAYARVFKKGQLDGYVRSDVEAEDIARFMVASLEGFIGLLKAVQSQQQWVACQSQLELYLRSLRVQ